METDRTTGRGNSRSNVSLSYSKVNAVPAFNYSVHKPTRILATTLKKYETKNLNILPDHRVNLNRRDKSLEKEIMKNTTFATLPEEKIVTDANILDIKSKYRSDCKVKKSNLERRANRGSAKLLKNAQTQKLSYYSIKGLTNSKFAKLHSAELSPVKEKFKNTFKPETFREKKRSMNSIKMKSQLVRKLSGISN